MGTLRGHAPMPSQQLRRMLAEVARQDRHRRIVLGPLGPSDVAELVRQETGQSPSPGVARSIQARTEGNPLFVRELARFLAEDDHLSDQAAAQAASALSIAQASGSMRTMRETVTAVNALGRVHTSQAVTELFDAIEEGTGF